MYWTIRMLRALGLGIAIWCTLAVFGGSGYWVYTNRPDLVLPIVGVIALLGLVVGTGIAVEEGAFS